MKVRRTLWGITALSLLSLVLAVAQAASTADLGKAKCPVSGKGVKEDKSVDYGGGKVYFCCGNCPKAFANNRDKFEAKANVQLVATGQAKQEACPISGKPVDEDQTAEVDGVTVAFCCKNCKGAVDKADDANKVIMCFGPEAMKKAFKVASE